MCTYATINQDVAGSAKGPNGTWFRVRRATVYFDHPVHAPAVHTINIDVADPEGGPSARVALELTAESAHALAQAIESTLQSVPEALLATAALTA